jgi:hypothetical protein
MAARLVGEEVAMLAAGVLFIYAIGLALAGVLAYSMAPEGANAKTALFVPGACAAVIALLAAGVAIAKRGKLKRGLHIAALVLMLVFAGAFAQRAMKASGAVQAHRNAAAQLESAIESGEVADTPEAREAFFEREGAPDHDKSYLANTLWGLVVFSALMFFVGLVVHPGRRVVRGPRE